MPKQEQVRKPTKTRLHNESEQETLDRPWGGRGRPDVKEGLDELLAEVDEALQGIDQDFATKFLQKGGE
jgi:hypothetical protein